MHSTGKQGQNDHDDNNHDDDRAPDDIGNEAEPNNMSSNRGLKRERRNPGEVD